MCCLTLLGIPECLSPGETPGVHTARPDFQSTIRKREEFPLKVEFQDIRY